jgi:hypothetical protein
VALQQLRRIRWAVRATLLLGVAASVLANILHALDNPISQAIAAWPPIALLLTVELISRVPVHRRLLAAARLAATAIIAGIAAWVSYWHMAGVAARYGETGASPYLLPLSVDGLIVVASICLVELGGRIASLERPAAHIMTDTLTPSAPQQESVSPEPASGRVPATGLAPAPAVHTAPGSTFDTGNRLGAGSPLRHSTAAAPAEVAATLPRSARGFTPAVTRGGGMAPRPGRPNGRSAPAQRRVGSASRGGSPGNTGAAHGGRGTAAKSRRSPAETVALAERIKAERPTLTETELAAELGISASRWRTVRREAAQSADRQLAA